MSTLTIEVYDDKALPLIEQLEALSLIRIVRNKKTVKGKKLSDRLAGSISQEQGDAMLKELEEMRKEWERDLIY